MESLLKDIRFGARMLVKRPGLTVLAVGALALGIGLTTTMFSIVEGALLRGLPFEESHRLMHLERNNLSEDIQSMEVTLHDYLDWREQQRSFEDIAGFYMGTVNISGSEGRPERYEGAFITANAFPMLRVQAALGRTFRPEETQPGGDKVVLLGHPIWENRYDSDPDVIGHTIRVNGEQATVIGVMPEGFKFPITEDVWVPLQMDPLELERGEGTTLEVFGRLKDGVTVDQARAELAAIARRLELEYPDTNEGVGSVIKPYTKEFIGEEPTNLLFTMLAAVFGVLLIACANVANLLLARATLRSKEVAIRSALGASRARVIMQMLAEAFVLSIVGTVIGVVIAFVGIRLFNNAIAPTDPPFWIDIGLHPSVLAFVAGLAVVSSLISGIVPAVRASGTDVNEVLKDESRGSSSFRIGKFSKGLVVAEVALSCGLLVAAGLTIKSVVKLRNVDFAFTTEDVLTARVGLFESDYPDEAARNRFFEQLQTRLQAKPGISEAALTTSLPTQSWGTALAIEGESYTSDREYPVARWATITPDFFRTFGVNLQQGRDFTWQDNAETLPVAIVNEPFARRHFPDESPLGRRIRLGRSDSEEPWLTIVGVVPDMHMDGVDNEEPEGIYVPLAQHDRQFMSIAARAQGDAFDLAPIVRDEVMAIDPNLPIYWVNTLAGVIAQNTWFYRVFGTLFMIFGVVALFLATVGLYGVMAFSVSSRTQEVGIRMALGADARDVLRLVFRQGLWQIGLGLLIGVGLAGLLSRGLQIILFEVEPWDPIIFASIALILILTGMTASFVPARRATRVDPMAALRYE